MPWPKPIVEEKKMPMLKEIVAKLCEKNPDLEKNQMYLLVEVWDYQGLKLYPAQRELLLSGELSTANGISRELRRYIVSKKPVKKSGAGKSNNKKATPSNKPAKKKK